MGCGASKPEEQYPVDDPLLKAYYAAPDYATKAKLIKQLAGQQEAQGKLHTAIKLHGTHLACMAAHIFKEADRGREQELIQLAQACRGVAAHRAMLQQKAIQEASQVCFGSPYIPTDPPAPGAIDPMQWSQYLIMVKGSGDVQKALEKMGLLQTRVKRTEVHHVHHAGGGVDTIPLQAPAPAQPSFVIGAGANVNFGSMAGAVNTGAGAGCTQNVVQAPAAAAPGVYVNVSPVIGGASASPVLSSAQAGEGWVAPQAGLGAGGSPPAAPSTPVHFAMQQQGAPFGGQPAPTMAGQPTGSCGQPMAYMAQPAGSGGQGACPPSAPPYPPPAYAAPAGYPAPVPAGIPPPAGAHHFM